MGRLIWGAAVLGAWGVGACSGATDGNAPPGGAGNASSGAAGTAGMSAGGSANPGGMSGAAGKPHAAGGSGAGGSGNTNSNLGGSSAGGHLGVGGGTGSAGNGGQACIPEDAPTVDPGSGSCPTFTACGGDLTGKWSVTLTCSDPVLHSYSVLCAGATDTTDVSGILEFKADGSYLAQAAVHTQGTVPQSCLTQFQATCGENPFEGCVPSGQGCTCDYRPPARPAAEGWTWKANGNVLSLLHDCQTELGYFCVQGNELQLRARNDANSYYVYHGIRQ